MTSHEPSYRSKAELNCVHFVQDAQVKHALAVDPGCGLTVSQSAKLRAQFRPVALMPLQPTRKPGAFGASLSVHDDVM